MQRMKRSSTHLFPSARNWHSMIPALPRSTATKPSACPPANTPWTTAVWWLPLYVLPDLKKFPGDRELFCAQKKDIHFTFFIASLKTESFKYLTMFRFLFLYVSLLLNLNSLFFAKIRRYIAYSFI